MEFIQGLDISPFSRILWWDGDAKNYWQNILTELRKFYHFLEYESVVRELRDVCTKHYNPNNLSDMMYELEKTGLHFLPIRRVGLYSGFAHRHPQPEPDKWNYYGVISKNIDKCVEFKEATDISDHEKMGQLLGYPKNSSKFFVKYFVEEKHCDPIWDIVGGELLDEYNKKVKPTLLTNIALRYFGFRWLPFFPSSWDSKDAKEFAKMFRNLGYEINKELAEKMDIILSMPYQWNCYKGIVEVVTPLFKGITNSQSCYPKYAIDFIPKDFELPKYSMIPNCLEKYL